MAVLETIDAERPDASFDLDGTVFKFTVLEAYTDWLSEQGIFRPMPKDIVDSKVAWKQENTEASYTEHLGLLVDFFIKEVPGKSVEILTSAADTVADRERHRTWNATTSLVEHLRKTHNVMAISLMPEWLMGSFVRHMGFVATIGSTYVTREGVFTDEAYTIDKASAYARHEHGTVLEIHVGDTVGDSSLFDLARHPVLFNPSWTLLSKRASLGEARIDSHKDVATVFSNGVSATFGAPFDAAQMLAAIRANA